MSTQQTTKTRRDTTKTSKRERRKFIFVQNFELTKNWFVVSIFHEFPEHYTEK